MGKFLGWVFVAAVVALFWFIYFAESETQNAVIWFVLNAVFGVWGFVSGLVQLLLGLGLLWTVAYLWWTIRSMSGNRGCVAVLATLAWTAFAVPGGLWLAFLGVFGLIA